VTRSLRLPRREVLGIVALAALTFAVTLAVMLSRTGADTRARAEQARRDQEKNTTAPPLSQAELALSPGDFLLPSAPSAPTTSYIPWRPRAQRWTADMVAPFWVDPKVVAAEILAAVNDRAVEGLFDSTR
jgi:hypothetical protein